jgi:hypothetical protein
MTAPEPTLIEEIQQRLRATPKGAIIDPLAWATVLVSGYSNTVDEIHGVVVKEAKAAGVTCLEK